MESVRESYLESDYCEEGFLSPQADAFAGANAEEKASACSVGNDKRWVGASMSELELRPPKETDWPP